MARQYQGQQGRKYLLTRHSIKPKGEDKESEVYKGISNKGVALARERAKEILSDMEEAEAGTVLFLGGATDQIRTASTAMVYGHEMKRLIGNNKGYVVVTPEDLQGAKGPEEIKRVIDGNPDKKIIIVYPQAIKSLSLVERGWMSKEGKAGAYYDMLTKNYKGEYDQLKHWIETRGVEGKIKGPSPDAVARGYEKAAHRLEGEIRSLVGDRPAITGFVGHSFEIDTFLAYLAGNGRIDLESLEAVESGKGMVKETEKALITIEPEVTTINYRGRKQVQHDLEDIVGALLFVAGIGAMGFLSVKANTMNMTGFAIKDIVTAQGIGFGFLASLGFLVSSCLLMLKKKKVKNNHKIMLIRSLT